MYDTTDVHKEKTPTYRFGSSTKKANIGQTLDHSPAPGQYTPQNMKAGPAYTFGGKKQSAVGNDAPGPGAYDRKDNVVKSSTPSIKFSTTNRGGLVSKASKDAPGPGAYERDVSFGRSGPSYTMNTKGRPQTASNQPGPGQYDADPSKVKDKTPSFQLGKTKRGSMVSKDKAGLPGPGNYSVDFANSGPSFTF